MRALLAISSLVSCSILFVSPVAAGKQTTRGPWPLLSLAALGAVTWRCDPQRPGLATELPGLALGLHASRVGQTGRLRLSAAGHTILSRVTQPGQTIPLPYLHARVQRLEISAGGEDGTLRATSTVTLDLQLLPVVHPAEDGCASPSTPLAPRRELTT